MNRGDIVWLDFTPQSGLEQKGRRPAVVTSPAAFNALSNCILVCPITTNTAPWAWKVDVSGTITGSILVDQIKSVDATARHATQSGQKLDTDQMDEVLARLSTLTA